MYSESIEVNQTFKGIILSVENTNNVLGKCLLEKLAFLTASYFKGIVSQKFYMLLLVSLDSQTLSTPFLLHPFFKISSCSCQIFDYLRFRGDFLTVPKQLTAICTLLKNPYHFHIKYSIFC
jgi:hypothetical protein